jgi:hypothetical protein
MTSRRGDDNPPGFRSTREMDEERQAERREAARKKREAHAGHTNGGGAPDAAPPKPRYDWRKGRKEMQEVQTMTFDPLKFLVPGLIPAEGVTLISSKPKVGKSWLLLDLGLAATMDRYTLGDLKVAQGDVLYLALEDSFRRLQARATKLLPTFAGKWPKTLAVTTEWRRVDEGGLQDLREWVEETRQKGHKVAFIAIDVLKMIRPQPKAGKQPYDLDYEAIVGLRQLANDLHVAILIATHNRKAGSDDLIDLVSATLGLTAAVDAIIVIDRQGQSFVFDVRGRDIEADTLAAEFNKDTCRWTILGDAATVRHSVERQQVLDIFRDAEGGPLTPKSVTERLAEVSHLMSHSSPRSHSAIRKILGRMAHDRDLVKLKYGEYCLPIHPLSHSHSGTEKAEQRPEV